MGKHTEGPWVVELSGRMVATAADGANGYELFDVRHDVPDFQENAKLVEPVHELLEALEVVLNAGRGTSGRIILDAEDEAIARAAIARARGEA